MASLYAQYSWSAWPTAYSLATILGSGAGYLLVKGMLSVAQAISASTGQRSASVLTHTER